MASNGGKIADYEGVDKAHEALPPLVAVNTTAELLRDYPLLHHHRHGPEGKNVHCGLASDARHCHQ